MDAVKLALLAVAASACTSAVSPDQPWVPIGDITAGPLVPDVAPPPMMAVPHDGPVRIVTYNVQYAPDVAAIAAAIQDDPDLARADVIMMQEIEAYPDEPGTRAAQIAERLQLGYVYVPARQKDTGTHGLAILSRLPLTNVERMDLPETSQELRLRIAVRADLDLGGSILPIVNVHLDTMLNATERIAQLHPAVIDAPALSVVAGDFNMSRIEWIAHVPILAPSSSDQAPIVDSYMRALDFETPTADCGSTEHMYGFEQRLDAIYTRGLPATFGAVPRVGPSDHWPMWIDVTP